MATRALTMLSILMLLPIMVSEASVMSQRVFAAIDKPVMFNCSGPDDKSSVVFLYWDVSDGTQRIVAGQSTPTLQVLDAGWSLYIPAVNAAHYGTYVCAYNATTGEHMNYTELLELPLSTFERYRLNILVGVVAAVAGVIILAIICAVYNCTWERRHRRAVSDGKSLVREEYPQATTSRPSSTVGGAHTNDVYVNDAGVVVADVTVKNTKL